MTTVDVEQMVEREQDGSSAAISSWDFESLYRSHYADAVLCAARICRDPDAAHDIVQEAFVRIFSRIRPIRDREAFGGYLRRTVVNVALSRSRSITRRRERERRSVATVPAAPAADTQVAADAELWEELEKLPRRQREVLMLRFWIDMSEADIARVLKCRPSTVRSLAARALASLRKELG